MDWKTQIMINNIISKPNRQYVADDIFAEPSILNNIVRSSIPSLKMFTLQNKYKLTVNVVPDGSLAPFHYLLRVMTDVATM